MISIHAPREGGDLGDIPPIQGVQISIHAPREGGDDALNDLTDEQCEFQSTPPVRGATLMDVIEEDKKEISIHAPREGGDSVVAPAVAAPAISIHAPREGGDLRAVNRSLRR